MWLIAKYISNHMGLFQVEPQLTLFFFTLCSLRINPPSSFHFKPLFIQVYPIEIIDPFCQGRPEACTTKLVQLNLDILELAGWRNPKHTRWR